MARVRLCVCGSWFVGREGQAAHPRAPGQCLHFECRGAPARVRVWRCEGRPPLPHHFVCVEKFTLPYLTLPAELAEPLARAREACALRRSAAVEGERGGCARLLVSATLCVLYVGLHTVQCHGASGV